MNRFCFMARATAKRTAILLMSNVRSFASDTEL